MVDLVPIGPRSILMAYGYFALEVFHSTTAAGDEGSGSVGDPIIVEWDVCGEADDKEPEEYTQTICAGPGRMLEITYLVIPNAIEANVEVRLKLKDLDYRSRVVVHLFSCERGRSWSAPSGSPWILPLSPSVTALPYRRQLELHLEVDLTVIAISISGNQEEEEETNLKVTGLKFTHRVGNQEREVNGDQVEVNITWSTIFS
uniref:Uncharacterized protein n=1 Tax=Setaria italica TaxID=4555 RepID=K4AFB8_SETIT